MIDILKKVQEIDKKGANINDPYLKEFMEQTKKAIESMDFGTNEDTFSNDINQFNSQCRELINYTLGLAAVTNGTIEL